MKKVLREIKEFGPTFDHQKLDAFVHLVAPPEKAKPAETEKQETAPEMVETKYDK